MNFSHGSHEYHQSVIDNTRKMVAGEEGFVPVLDDVLLTRCVQTSPVVLSRSLSIPFVVVVFS